MDIEINQQFKRALDIMENSSRNVFITGRAGTGKSTLLEYFRSITRKNMVALAPTGVAALNVQGQTIHSFFHFKPDITPTKVINIRVGEEDAASYKGLQAVIIDEVSMVRADLLDCMNTFLQIHGPKKNKPFGGLQMIFIGDLYQLPPVVTGDEKQVFQSMYETPYFFSAHAFNGLEMELVELEDIYRQQDQRFISMLNAIRNNSVTEDDMLLLNEQYNPDFEPKKGEFFICLTTTNALADQINLKQLNKLRERSHTFKAEVKGDFGKDYIPTRIELKLKLGAQIMMLNNDTDGRWVNGTIGTVLGIRSMKNGEDCIEARLAHGETVDITPYTWEIFRFFMQDGHLQSEVVGTFTQFPLMLAWAVTIHKSQGKTFGRVIIDIGKGTFAHGQMYVALSRCTTLEGLVLRQKINKNNIWADYRVVKFLTRFQYEKAEQTTPMEQKVQMIKKAIKYRQALKMVYLRPNDEKSSRIVEPQSIGESEYNGVKFLGMRAFCLKRHETRTFRVDRILEIQEM